MGTYWRLFMWLQTWSPLYAVLNFVMFWEAQKPARRDPELKQGWPIRQLCNVRQNQ